jgi:putative peptidoglycan lipid II flippase
VIAAAVMPTLVDGPTGSTARLVVVELAPLGVLGAVTGSLGAVLAVGGRFAPAVAVMTIEPVLKSVLTLLAGDAIGINALIIGNVAGSALAALALWWTLVRNGVRLVPTVAFRSTFVRSVVGVSVPLVVSQSVLQANPLVDRAMAGSLGGGSVTALEIGLRICLIPTSLLTGLMITPITATWAERRMREGWPEVRRSVSRALAAILAFSPFIVGVGLVLRRELVGFAYQGGAYSQHALHETVQVFAMTLLALPAQLVVVVVATLFVIERATVVPMLIGVANVVLNVGLNFMLRPVLGVAGIALSTTVTVVLLSIAYVVLAHRRWQPFGLSVHVERVALGLAGAVAATGCCYAVRSALPMAESRVAMFTAASTGVACGGAVYAAVLRGGGLASAWPSRRDARRHR